MVHHKQSYLSCRLPFLIIFQRNFGKVPVVCIETQNPITQALSKNSTLNFFIHVMLYFGGKSCFLMEKLKVGNKDQTELDTDGQSVKF